MKLTMSRNTFLLSVLAAASISSIVESKSISKSAPDHNHSRIVGGNQARVGDYPYFVEMGGCGGALVAPDVVLFAAHCGNFENQQLSIGAYRTGFTDEGAQGRFCEEWIQDPLFNPYVIEYDFALCKLNKPVVIDDTEVELAINFDDDEFMTVGDPLLVMGLGTLEQGGFVPEYLQDVTVPYLSNEECNRDDLYAGEVTEIMFCAGIPVTGGKDSCQGDSGGPIVKRTIKNDGSILDTLVGVVSWGNGCGVNWPGVYARTSKRANWIQDTICNDFESVAPFCDNGSSESDIQCDGEDLTVTITTDEWADETSWSLTDSSGTEVMTRAYLYKNFENEHKLCLKSNECYEWTIFDSFGDGQCTVDDDSLLLYGCGSYAFTLNGEEILSGSAFEDGYSTTETFCTGGAVVSPPEPQTNIFCKDDNEVRFADGKGRKKSCKKYIKGRRKKMRKRCKSTVKGVVVSESCPKTCGEKAGVGRCVR